jgi:hypothetical protein
VEVQTGSQDSERIEVVKKQLQPRSPGAKPHWVDFTGEESIVPDAGQGLSDGQAVTVTATP